MTGRCEARTQRECATPLPLQSIMCCVCVCLCVCWMWVCVIHMPKSKIRWSVGYMHVYKCDDSHIWFSRSSACVAAGWLMYISVNKPGLCTFWIVRRTPIWTHKTYVSVWKYIRFYGYLWTHKTYVAKRNVCCKTKTYVRLRCMVRGRTYEGHVVNITWGDHVRVSWGDSPAEVSGISCFLRKFLTWSTMLKVSMVWRVLSNALICAINYGECRD